jgi:hypothetical protein
MPKRRIRDRLSAEHAATIDFPPQPTSSSPIFGGYPYGAQESDGPTRRGLRAGSHEHVPCVDCGHEHSELESEEEILDVDGGSEFGDEGRGPAMQFEPGSLQMTRRDGEYYGE